MADTQPSHPHYKLINLIFVYRTHEDEVSFSPVAQVTLTSLLQFSPAMSRFRSEVLSEDRGCDNVVAYHTL
jgi:hypothetical protein